MKFPNVLSDGVTILGYVFSSSLTNPTARKARTGVENETITTISELASCLWVPMKTGPASVRLDVQYYGLSIGHLVLCSHGQHKHKRIHGYFEPLGAAPGTTITYGPVRHEDFGALVAERLFEPYINTIDRHYRSLVAQYLEER